jgi:hypothetical protein
LLLLQFILQPAFLMIYLLCPKQRISPLPKLLKTNSTVFDVPSRRCCISPPYPHHLLHVNALLLRSPVNNKCCPALIAVCWYHYTDKLGQGLRQGYSGGCSSSHECADLVNKHKTHESTREDDAHYIAVGEMRSSQEIKAIKVVRRLYCYGF